MSERSEFGSFPSLQQKFKEGVAISGAPFFAYFLWQDKESESPPAGGETGDAPQPKTQQEMKKGQTTKPIPQRKKPTNQTNSKKQNLKSKHCCY